MTEWWSVPPMWERETVAIYASGPSMTPECIEATRGMHCIVVNDTYRLVPDADILYAADEKWWAVNPQALQFPGLKVTIGSWKSNSSDILRLRNTGVTGFDSFPDCLRTGNNSGYQALHLALHMWPARILLFGFDMHAKKGHHWFGKHKPPLYDTDAESYRNRAERFWSLAAAAKHRGIDVINCSPGSAITAFPIHALSEVV